MKHEKKAMNCVEIFNKIITYLNITDDIAAGNSHFKAGVLRAQDIIKTYKKCKEYEYVIAAKDEAFNGTTFKKVALYKFHKFIDDCFQRRTMGLKTLRQRIRLYIEIELRSYLFCLYDLDIINSNDYSCYSNKINAFINYYKPYK